MKYINENLLPGNIGYLFVILSFVGALFALISYSIHWRNREKKHHLKLGRLFFITHGISVLGIFVVLFYLIYNKQYQYHYVWAHSDNSLPIHYIISCFWEGQEGSFLLWTFWHAVLGIILIFRAGIWESRVLPLIALAQVMLASMLLGINEINVLGASIPLGKIGSNPFILLRNVFPENNIFNNPDYVSLLTDGNGLNILLQNYWMVIHPPVLFLGFALTIIPFAFAIGGYVSKAKSDWVKPALPWTLWTGGILGLGILMGGAWAYEALSFGGFWAWDPVENASLVPWLTLVAGLHGMLIYNARKKALGTGFFFVGITFILILYSTFLTRSGILGDSSVHSFTDLGLSGQLLLFLFLFVAILIVVPIIYRNREKPKSTEDKIYSREFWMLIGTLLLAFSALHITVFTSLEVVNKINESLNSWLNLNLSTTLSKPADAIETYHQLQIPLAIVILIFIAFTQFLSYLKTPVVKFWRNTLAGLALGVLLTIATVLIMQMTDLKFLLLTFAGWYAVGVNVLYHIKLSNRNLKRLHGSALAHIGFALIIIGSVVSQGMQKPISINNENFEALQGAPEKEQKTNKVLFKNVPVKMDNYMVTYLGDSSNGKNVFFKVNYQKVGKENKVTEEFTLHPYVVFDNAKDEMSAPSPDTRHYWNKDVFTHITSASKKLSEEELVLTFDTSQTFSLLANDSFSVKGNKIIVSEIERLQSKNAQEGEATFKVIMKLDITAENGMNYKAEPSFIIAGNQLIPEPADIPVLGLRFVYNFIDVATNKHQLIVLMGKPQQPEFITLKAIVFPGINIMWIGSILMVIGFLVASRYRRPKKIVTIEIQ